jgi:hypothetical protein
MPQSDQPLTDEPEPAADPLGERFALLANRERRHLLYCLRSSPAEVDLEELAACVASCRNPPADPTRTRTRLHHHHLPRLADAGLVVYDGDAGRIEVTAQERIADLLEPFETDG